MVFLIPGTSHWESQSLPPPRCSILPALARFHFKGVTEYLEELVTRIGAPQLGEMYITFFNQVDFDFPRLTKFINCTPTLIMALDEARVQFNDATATVILRPRTSGVRGNLLIHISCRGPDWQPSSMEQVCNYFLRILLTVENLYIEHLYSLQVRKKEAIENDLWLQFFLPFTAVKNLYLSKEFVPGTRDVLKELDEGRITEVLPSLQNIFVKGLRPSGSFHEEIGQFIATRWLSDHPIAISIWDKDQLKVM